MLRWLVNCSLLTSWNKCGRSIKWRIYTCSLRGEGERRRDLRYQKESGNLGTFFWSRHTQCIQSLSGLRPWQTRTHCCGHIVADTNVSPFARARNICCGHKFCVRDTKNVSDFVQKHIVSATMFPSLRSPRNIMGNNVSATMCPRLPGPLKFATHRDLVIVARGGSRIFF